MTSGVANAIQLQLRYRHIAGYRLDGEDAGVRASGFDVLDMSMTKRVRRLVDFNLSIDNLTDKRYFETQNYFESRVSPGAESARAHSRYAGPSRRRQRRIDFQIRREGIMRKA